MSGPGATPAAGLGFPLFRPSTAVVPRKVRSNARLLSVLPLIFIIGCGTTGIKPEEKLVSSVTSLPPVQVPVPVRCVDKVPPIPNVTIDPNATVLQRYYAMRQLIAALDEYSILANAALMACAMEPKK